MQRYFSRIVWRAFDGWFLCYSEAFSRICIISCEEDLLLHYTAPHRTASCNMISHHIMLHRMRRIEITLTVLSSNRTAKNLIIIYTTHPTYNSYTTDQTCRTLQCSIVHCYLCTSLCTCVIYISESRVNQKVFRMKGLSNHIDFLCVFYPEWDDKHYQGAVVVDNLDASCSYCAHHCTSRRCYRQL